MGQISQFLIVASISQMLLGLLVIGRQGFRYQGGGSGFWLFGLLLLCGAGYLLGQLPLPVYTPIVIQWLIYLGSNSLVGIFWLTMLGLFTENQGLKLWQYGLGSMTLVLPSFMTLQSQLMPDMALIDIYAGVGLMMLELILATHALYMASRHWRDDLIEQRRNMRVIVVGFLGCYLFSVILFEQVLQWQWTGRDTLKYSLVMVLITGINVLLLSLREDGLFGPLLVPATPSSVVKPGQSAPLSVLLQAMLEQKLYLQEGLTISHLAKQLSMQEYKLRRLINGELKYRNFNDFLNQYRVSDVAVKLADPHFDKTPILTLALESGFRSLSSFNQAFRNIHQQTPSEFRHLQRLSIKTR